MKKTLLSLAFAAVCAGGLTTAMAGTVTATLEDNTNDGGFFATVTISDLLNATNQNIGLTFVLDIAPPVNTTLTKGDILGVWFDVNSDGEALLPSLSSTGLSALFTNVDPVGTIQQAVFRANSVSNKPFEDKDIKAPEGNFDFAIQVGQRGNGGGFNQTVSFDMMYAGLSTSMFNDQRVAMRVQSIEGATGFNEGSSKLLGEGELPPTTPNNPPTTPDEPPTTPDEPPVPPAENEVPLPSTLLLLGAGLLGMGASFRRRLHKTA
ncbi:PEP-CTERM sorting domain-containing protein [Thiospirillum jenense]|uniref:PEP-CTERM sorting domain-containing protein n=2 Tax=Thiospirillum jenense TaxID=1653858 RepID=A0A839HDI7_9GAMM|nr:PEP-CTERM sorting domain-containing protein [Thiospirillum jenense]